mgnify:FL=1
MPYSANSLEEADTIMHVVKMPANEMRKMQVSGFYLDIELGSPSYSEDDIREGKADLEGTSGSNKDEVYTIIECHTELDLDGFQDMNPETGEPTEIKLPYVVTVDEGTGKVLSIRRNFDAQDPTRQRKDFFVQEEIEGKKKKY